MKEWLKKLKRQKEARAGELRAAIRGSQSADEVRSLGTTLDEVLAELQEIDDRLAELEEQGEDGADDEEPDGQRANDPSDAMTRALDPHAAMGAGGLRPAGSFRSAAASSEDVEDDPFASIGYRRAFMDYVARGVSLPDTYREAVSAATRADAVTTTGDVGAVIPSTLVRKIISEMSTYGNIWAKVTKTNLPGGVEIPIMDLKPTAHWVTEDKPSEDQKLKADKSISFKYHMIECKISQSLLASVVVLDIFEAKFVELATEAIVRGVESAIVSGTGEGMPLGILKDPRVKSANVVILTPEDMGSWSAWKKKVWPKMKKAYRKGDFLMAQGTFDGYIDGMVDSTGQPIGRVNYGNDKGEVYRFGGKDVETVEDDVLPDWETAAVGDVVAIFCDLSNYTVNSNMQMQTVKWIDHDTNKAKDKVMMVCDGKLVDPAGVIIIKKGAAAAAASE